jgi:hypothetical protein
VFVRLERNSALIRFLGPRRIAVLFDGEDSTAPHVDIADVEHKIAVKQGNGEGLVMSVKSVESA